MTAIRIYPHLQTLGRLRPVKQCQLLVTRGSVPSLTLLALPVTVSLGTCWAHNLSAEEVKHEVPLKNLRINFPFIDEVSPSTPRAKLRQWRRVFRALMRAGYLFLLSTPLLGVAVTARILGPAYPEAEAKIWDYVTRFIERSGPTLIKLAQWAASREDMFPAALTSKFARLQDNNHPHSWNDTVTMLRKNLGPGWQKVLTLEREPIGTGCIAQVHRGIIRDTDGNERTVAVKVLHPGIMELVETDMDLLRWITDVASSFPRAEWLALRETVDSFNTVFVEQLNMNLEFANLAKLRRHFRDNTSVVFPEPLFSTHDVLIEKFMEGQPIRSFYSSEEPTKKRLSKIGIDTMLNMVFLNNFVHADLHPGNILVNTGPDGCSPPTMVILDAGMAVELTASTHRNMLDVMIAFFRNEGYQAGQLLVEGTRHECSDVEGFCRDIERMCDAAGDSNFFDKFGSYVTKIMGMACTYKVQLNDQFVTMAMAIKVLEGMALSLNPEVDLIESSIPVLLKASVRYQLGSWKWDGVSLVRRMTGISTK